MRPVHLHQVLSEGEGDTVMSSMMKNLALALGLLATTTATASAGLVYGTDVDSQYWSGADATRSGSGEIDGTFGTTVSWTITKNSDETWRYDYTFTGNKNISHLLLELSDDATTASVWDLTGGTWGDLKDYDSTVDGNSNPGFPTNTTIWAIKVTPTGKSETFNFAFNSDRSPVWGNFYTKGGQNYAYNAGMGIAGFDSNDINNFIARPNGGNGVVPEPTSIALMGLGTVGLIGFTARRRKSRSA